MEYDLVKFVPRDLRLEIAQKVIEMSGIRPLAREIDIDPKSVYKYKNGSAKPGDKVTNRLLAVLKRDYPELMDKYIEKLNENFNEAMRSSINPNEILPEGGEGSGLSNNSVDQESTKSKQSGVDRKSSTEKKEKSVAQESTEREDVDRGPTVNGEGSSESSGEDKSTESGKEPTAEMFFDNICKAISVNNPFDQKKVQKIIDSFEEGPYLEFDQIVELTGLSEDALEGYLEDLSEEEIIEKTDTGSYRILVRVMEG